MTMPKFESVAEVLWYDPVLRMTPEPAGKIIDSSLAFIESAAIGTQLYTSDQLTEAYEAGKRDAIPEWQPIETAPKDGTRIIGYFPEEGYELPMVMQCVFDDGDWQFDVWAAPADRPALPTRWMPLPAAPKGEE